MYTIGNVEVIKENGATTYRRSVAGAIIRFEPTIDQDVTNSPVAFAITDHLGSTTVIRSDDPLMPSQHQYFQPFGGKMDLTVGGSLFSYWTDRSFTGHEEIESAGIIHMGGRIYDPQLGRFLQADPFVQAPDNSQSLNRFSYVINNPLSYTDPSGFFFTRLLGQIWRPIVNIVGCAAGTASAQPYLCGATVAATSAASGESLTKSLRNGAVAGVSAFAFNEIGETIEALKASEQLVRATVTGIFAHGAVGAASAAIQGGDPLAGFLGAGLAKGFSIRAGDFLEGLNNLVIESIIVGTVGGTISSVTGGKFVNGATTAAIGYVYNQRARLNRNEPKRNPNFTTDEIDAALEEAFLELKQAVAQDATDKPSAAKIIAAKLVPLGKLFRVEIGADFGCINTECYVSKVATDYLPGNLIDGYKFHTHPTSLQFSPDDIQTAFEKIGLGSYLAADISGSIEVLYFDELAALEAIGRGETTERKIIDSGGGKFTSILD